MTDYQVGTTIVLQASYFDTNDSPLDADSVPTVEVRDARNRSVQTGLTSLKTATGVYQTKFDTTGLTKGTYYHVWSALFNGYPDIKSGSFVLRDIVT